MFELKRKAMCLRIRDIPSLLFSDQHNVFFSSVFSPGYLGETSVVLQQLCAHKSTKSQGDQCNPCIIGNVRNPTKFLSLHFSGHSSLPLNHTLKGISSRAIFISSSN